VLASPVSFGFGSKEGQSALAFPSLPSLSIPRSFSLPPVSFVVVADHMIVYHRYTGLCWKHARSPSRLGWKRQLRCDRSARSTRREAHPVVLQRSVSSFLFSARITSRTSSLTGGVGVSLVVLLADLVPIAQRSDLSKSEQSMERPSEDEVFKTAERTKAALEKLTNGKIKAAQPSRVGFFFPSLVALGS